MIIAAVAIGGLGVVAAVALGVAAKVFYVEVDPLIEEIESALPGANCGGCGQPGCSGAASAMATGKIPPNACVAGGADTAKMIAAIMGVEVKETEPEIAKVGCRYPIARADVKFSYHGVNDCRAAILLNGGPKECPIGCIGLGSCIKSCPFDALHMGADGIPEVDEQKCTGCGTCVRTCPMGIIRLTSVTNRILNELDWSECTAPCQRRCPAGIDVPEQIYQTNLGNYDRALAVIKERNPLPLICGRICPHPCEQECRRNLVDEPVAINHLKRFVADYELKRGRHVQPFKAPATNKHIAVIGGGVEGLSAAYFLARLGHSPKIFEARDKMGGLLRSAIPESRLPREVLDWEIEGILDMGVEAETGRALGSDFGLGDLFDQGHEAILLAVGGWDALLTPGLTAQTEPVLSNLLLLLPLSLAWAEGRDIGLGANVVIVGSSREILSAARRCLKKGAASVTVLARGTLDSLNLTQADLKRAGDEGIMICPQARVTGISGQGARIDHLTYTSYRQEHAISTDSVIVAGGRMPELIVVRDPEPVMDGEEPASVAGADARWHAAAPYSPARQVADLFAPRQAVSDHWAAVDAIGAGRRAAATIHALLANEVPEEPEVDLTRGAPMFDVDQLENLAPAVHRQPMPESSDRERLDLKHEVALGFDEEKTRAEAARCLQCGLICYQRTRYH